MKPGITLLLLITVTLSVLYAQSRFRLPPSPTGNIGTVILEMLDTDDEEVVKDFVRNRLDSDFHTNYGEAELVKMMQEIRNELGKFELTDIRKTDSYAAILGVQSTNGEARFNIEYSIEPEPPHLINGLMFDTPDEHAANLSFSSLEELDAYLIEASEAGDFSGVVLLAIDDEIRFNKAYGYASRRYQVKNQPDTKFNIGSINKMFTGIAILQLVQAGKVDIDATMDTYLDGFPEEIGSRVTVRHLLQHKSGWGSYWDIDYYNHNWPKLRSVEDYLVFIREEPLDFEPGTSRQYSNTGYVVLGAIIEKASGQSYDNYVQQNLFDKCGMKNTYAYEVDLSVQNLAIGYTYSTADGRQTDQLRENIFTHSAKGTPAGGGYSTAEDLYAFHQALLADKLLSRKYTDMFLNRYDPEADSRPKGVMGLAGGGPGISATYELDLGGKFAAIILANQDPPAAEELGPPLVKLLGQL